MNRLRLLLWAVLAWPLPALIAGALGWKGVWGSDSALVDYLIPIPVAGGVLHVPSFLLGALAVYLFSTLGNVGASRLRALLLGVAIAGFLWLLDLPALMLAWQTGGTPAGDLWQENPLGLFLLCDALLALALGLSAPQRPFLKFETWSALLVLLPALLPLSMARPRTVIEEPFRPGVSREGEMRGDEWNMAFTRLPPTAPDFRAKALDWIASRHPRFNVNVEDMAVVFTQDFDAARRFEITKGDITLCLYEDGTPTQWLTGVGDCFAGHLTFAERWAMASAQRPAGEDPDLSRYFSARSACAEVTPPAVANDGVWTSIAGIEICGLLPRWREELAPKFPDAFARDEPLP